MNCEEKYTRIGSNDLCWFEWGQKTEGEATVFLVHATGFHARCWDETVRHLGERHVIAVDMRGHGRSGKNGPFSWNAFGSDLIELIKILRLNRMIGVGHSMGGHAITIAASEHQARFERLVLIDPVIVDPVAYQSRDTAKLPWVDGNGQHPVAKRKNLFESAEAMYQNFSGRGSFAVWEEQVLRDYCTYGILPNPDGDGFVLACPPSIEASIYMGSSGTDVYERITRIQTPTVILRAKERDPLNTQMDFSTSPTWPALASKFPSATDVHLPSLTHFIPMQAPALAAEYILGTR